MTLKDLEILEIKTEPHHIDPYKHNGKWIKEEDIKADIIKICKELSVKRHIHLRGLFPWGSCSSCKEKRLKKQALMKLAGIKEEYLK